MTSQLLEKQSVPSGEEDVRQYLRDIRQFPLLTPQEERLLAQRCAEGDEEAIRRMVDSNLRLVVSVAREYAGRGVPLMDLVQEGSIGLLAAVRRFDYTMDFRFSTYATKWIRQGITRCLVSHGLIRIPTHTAEKMQKIRTVQAMLLQEHGVAPTPEEMEPLCGMSAAKLRELLRLDPETCSLDAPVGEEDGTLALVLEDLAAPQPYEELVREELNHTMEQLLSALNERQRQVLRLRFGMEDGECHTLEQIGQMLGVSKERARQIEQLAMEKLQKMGSTMGLEDFLE